MSRFGSVAEAVSRLPQETGPAVTGPWPMLRIVVDVVTVFIVATAVVTLSPGLEPIKTAPVLMLLGVCFGLAGLVSLWVGRYADEEELGGYWLVIERLSPLVLVPTGAGLLLFPTAVSWGFLELLVVSCCPLLALSRLGRVRALVRLQIGLALVGALVLDPGAAVFVPPFLVALCVALALEHFGSAFAALPDERPAHVATVVLTGAVVSLLVAQPVFLLALWALPAWDRDLSGAPLNPTLSAQAAEGMSVLEMAALLGLLILCGYLWRLLVAGTRAGGTAGRSDDTELLEAPDAAALSDAPRRQWQASRRWAPGQAAVIDAWLALERTAQRRGEGRAAGETPSRFASRVVRALRRREAGEAAQAVTFLSHTFGGVRYGPQSPDPAEVRAAKVASVTARRALKAAKHRPGPPTSLE